jgi:hypothetical protein
MEDMVIIPKEEEIVEMVDVKKEVILGVVKEEI